MADFKVGDRVSYVFRPKGKTKGYPWGKVLADKEIFGTVESIDLNQKAGKYLVQWDKSDGVKESGKRIWHYPAYLELVKNDVEDTPLVDECQCPSLLAGHREDCSWRGQYRKKLRMRGFLV